MNDAQTDQQQPTRRNYAKATKGFRLLRIEFFDDDAPSAIPRLADLKDLRAADGQVTISMLNRSADPDLERYRRSGRIGVVGESNETAFAPDGAPPVHADLMPLPGMRAGSLG